MISKLRNSFWFAWAGLVIAWREEKSFKIEIGAAVLAILLSLYLHISRIEFVIIIFVIFFVLSVEALNTSLEEICDKFHPDHDPHIAKIKDLAAAAVFLAVIGSVVIALLIFIPHLAPL